MKYVHKVFTRQEILDWLKLKEGDVVGPDTGITYEIHNNNFCEEIELARRIPVSLDEQAIIRNIPDEYRYITRDESDTLTLWSAKPVRGNMMWLNEQCYGGRWETIPTRKLFQFVSWNDSEPISLDELRRAINNQ